MGWVQGPYLVVMVVDTFRLEDRLSVVEGTVALSGIQAILDRTSVV